MGSSFPQQPANCSQPVELVKLPRAVADSLGRYPMRSSIDRHRFVIGFPPHSGGAVPVSNFRPHARRATAAVANLDHCVPKNNRASQGHLFCGLYRKIILTQNHQEILSGIYGNTMSPRTQVVRENDAADNRTLHWHAVEFYRLSGHPFPASRA